MDGLTPALEDALLRFLSVEPLRVYAIAYLFHLGTAARRAARKLLEIPSFAEPSSPPPEFGDLPALALYAVMVYRSSCVEAALARISRHQNSEHLIYKVKKTRSLWIWCSCRAHPVHAGTPAINSRAEGGTIIDQQPSQWWWEYINSLTAALSSRPVSRLATDLSLLEPPVTEASKCPTCRPFALSEMVTFSKYLEWEIEQGICGVRGFFSACYVCSLYSFIMLRCRSNCRFELLEFRGPVCGVSFRYLSTESTSQSAAWCCMIRGPGIHALAATMYIELGIVLVRSWQGSPECSLINVRVDVLL